jgi:elongation factor 3
MKVGFAYPTAPERKILKDITIYCSLSSRVMIVGPNGAGGYYITCLYQFDLTSLRYAGKSTLVKLLCGELVANEGSVWRHPNLRVAYVAQHAFHHLEQHLDKTPNEYIQWRYATGEDREAMDKESLKATEEEEAKMAQKVTIAGA